LRNEDFVKVYYDQVVEVGAENVVHGTLKGRRCVGEAKGHDFELVVAVACAKCCFGNIIMGDADLPVAGFEVNLGQHRGALKSVEMFFSPWYGGFKSGWHRH
jgi:hypothetical protein